MQQIDVPKFHVPSHIKNFRCCARVELTDCAGKLVSRHMSSRRLASPPVRTSEGEPGWGFLWFLVITAGSGNLKNQNQRTTGSQHFSAPKEPTRLHERTGKDPEGFRRLSYLKQSENCGHVEYHPGIWFFWQPRLWIRSRYLFDFYIRGSRIWYPELYPEGFQGAKFVVPARLWFELWAPNRSPDPDVDTFRDVGEGACERREREGCVLLFFVLLFFLFFSFLLVLRCCCCRCCCFCHRYHDVAECCRSSRLFCLQLSFSFDNMRVTRFSSSSSCFSFFGSVACRRISSPSAAAAVRVFLCLLPLQLLSLSFVFCGPAFSSSFFFIFFSFSLYLRLSLALFVYLFALWNSCFMN